MDNPNPHRIDKSQNNNQFGMSAFGPQERNAFGRHVRLAMSCIDNSSNEQFSAPGKDPAIPESESALRRRLTSLSQEMTSQHADLLECLVRFDELKGWRSTGASHCAAWMNMEIGIGIQLGWEYLRVGRQLRQLPTLRALFRVGKISWSKVRLITRVADQENEKILCHAALDASVSDIKSLCQEYRWNDTNRDSENQQALQQWQSRSLTWDETSNGSTRIQLVLPPALAQAFLNSVEHALNQEELNQSTDTSTKLSTRRADAALLMAETSLQSAGKDISTADRYQVIVSVDESELSITNTQTVKTENTDTKPAKRPIVIGAGSIANETARRLACDCSVAIHKTSNGEPIDIGRKSRIWPKAMARAIKTRDQQCVWPGCTQSRHLHIHHIKHWADGGKTSVKNGASLCSHHHTLVHEGGYIIERVEHDHDQMHEQFEQQQHTHDTNQFEFEKSLRCDRTSFNKVRNLCPTRFRFHVTDAQGQDIRAPSNEKIAFANPIRPIDQSPDSTRVYCREPAPNEYYHRQYKYSHSLNSRLHAAEDQTTA